MNCRAHLFRQRTSGFRLKGGFIVRMILRFSFRILQNVMKISDGESMFKETIMIMKMLKLRALVYRKSAKAPDMLSKNFPDVY